MTKKIGGFFGLHLEPAATSESLLTLWNIPEYTHWSFSNGRSALHHLLLHLKPGTFWLPAYCCTSLAEAAANTNAILRFFPLTPDLSPDTAYLEKHLSPGDAVLAIDYFGRNPSKDFIAFSKQQKAIHWIEDRAQSLLPAAKPWGDFTLYTPRKLLGVPNGGIVVGITKKLPAQAPQDSPPNADFIIPSLLRYEDKAEAHNTVWYQANVAAESAMTVSNAPMSRISHYILQHLDVRSIIQKRKENYAVLMKHLAKHALLPESDNDFVPFGFPIHVQDRRKTASALHSQAVFAAHHWPELPSPQAEFPKEHAFSEQLLTLPCDHRYDVADMERVAGIVKTAL